VPERRRRVKLLAVLGFRYEDIGRLTGDSVTRVNQLMTEANTAVRRERAEMQGERSTRAPNARSV
jgi:DNA-directed RNA polymerase specialized sigma24 family protein